VITQFAAEYLSLDDTGRFHSGIIGTLVVLTLVKESRKNRTADGAAATPVSRAKLSKQFKIYLGHNRYFHTGQYQRLLCNPAGPEPGRFGHHDTLVLVMFNLVYTLVSVPAGVLSDKLGRRKVIIIGWIIYALVYLALPWPVPPGRSGCCLPATDCITDWWKGSARLRG
jgi:MFS family permease